jgi:F-type H+-transporting ATPase subunit b
MARRRSVRARSLVALVALAALFSVCAPGLAAAGEGEENTAHGAEHGEHGEASAEHGDDTPFNWAYGFVGEKDGEEPSLLYRPKGMAPPFLANVINFAILVTIIVSAGRKPIAEGLKKRKDRLVGSMEEAAKMKADSETSLAQYEKKLAHLDEEIERIRREMRESAEAERQRILTEAKERRERMERDAKVLIEQELKAAREILIRETVASAMKSAEELLAKQLGAADQDRIARDFLETVKTAPITSAGGRS